MSQHRDRDRYEGDSRYGRRGVILLITLVILVILATLGYTLTVQVAARRHRDQYMIDYSIARHACASGMKYALAAMEDVQFTLISRPNEPDFSDVFALTEPEYQALLDQMAVSLAEESLTEESSYGFGWSTTESNEYAFDDANRFDPNGGFVDKELQIPGPYGPPWPLVTEPVECEIGSAKVKIEIEDENAKYPLGWALLEDDEVQGQAEAGWTLFCEWMGYSPSEIGSLEEDLGRIAKMKPFKVEFEPESKAVDPPSSLRGRISRSRGRSPTRTAVRRRRRTIPVADQVEHQNKEFSRLFHSSLIDTELLARPSIESDSRRESALKYLGLWATRRVNVNTAPRHVLEAAFAFGSVADAPKIAEAVIQHRRVQPVTDVNELKQAVFAHSHSIQDCRDFLTARSTVFTIRVTATSGVATATALAAVTRDGDEVQRIAVLSGE